MLAKMHILFFGVLIASQADTIVVPNSNLGSNGDTFQLGLFGEGKGTYDFQWEMNGSQMASLTGESLSAIGFRLPAGADSIAGSTGITSFSLELSQAANPIGSLNSIFADNIGADAVTVVSGPLTIGPLTGGAGPNPFFLIQFSTPYLYSGGNLLMTAVIAGEAAIKVDANGLGDGFADTVGALGGVNSLTGTAELYNYPITEFQTTGQSGTVPEPGTFLLFGAGSVFLAARRSRLFRRR